MSECTLTRIDHDSTGRYRWVCSCGQSGDWTSKSYMRGLNARDNALQNWRTHAAVKAHHARRIAKLRGELQPGPAIEEHW